MYPSRFRYEAPRTVDEALELLHRGQGEAKVLAGGMSLIPLLKLRFASPDLLVDINGIPGLGYHRQEDDGSLRIGALCRHADLERSALLRGNRPTMAAAAPLVADPIVRNRGTLVGSLCHADPQGDWASVMTALRGQVVAHGPRGTRSIAVREFVSGPFETALAFDEIAVAAVVPAVVDTPDGGYLKLERRVGDFATASVAVAVERRGEQVTRAGIALGGVGPTTIAATAAEDSLVGGPLTAERVQRAADLAAEAARPRADHRGSVEYKRHIIHTFVTRILAGVTESAERAA